MLSAARNWILILHRQFVTTTSAEMFKDFNAHSYSHKYQDAVRTDKLRKSIDVWHGTHSRRQVFLRLTFFLFYFIRLNSICSVLKYGKLCAQSTSTSFFVDPIAILFSFLFHFFFLTEMSFCILKYVCFGSWNEIGIRNSTTISLQRVLHQPKRLERSGKVTNTSKHWQRFRSHCFVILLLTTRKTSNVKFKIIFVYTVKPAAYTRVQWNGVISIFFFLSN